MHGFSRDRSDNSQRLNFLPEKAKAAFSRGNFSGVGAELHRGRRRELIGGGDFGSCTRTGGGCVRA